MIRLGRSRARAELEIEPAVCLPTESLRAEVRLAESLDRVASARLQLGYVNTYTYRWAGRRDSAVRYDENLLGPSPVYDGGSERTTKDWVGVLEHELAVDDGTIAAGSQDVTLRIPSWAPGSSSVVRWVVRLQIEREGRPDVELEQTCRVLAPAPAAPAESLKHQLLDGGESADMLLDTEGTWFRAGEQLRGTVTITPKATPLPVGNLRVSLQRIVDSHPLERTPGAGDVYESCAVTVVKALALPSGEPTIVPFEIDLPEDSDPTSEAVHSSVMWYVVARVMYKGFSHSMDKVRREFVMVTG